MPTPHSSERWCQFWHSGNNFYVRKWRTSLHLAAIAWQKSVCYFNSEDYLIIVQSYQISILTSAMLFYRILESEWQGLWNIQQEQTVLNMAETSTGTGRALNWVADRAKFVSHPSFLSFTALVQSSLNLWTPHGAPFPEILPKNCLDFYPFSLQFFPWWISPSLCAIIISIAIK